MIPCNTSTNVDDVTLLSQVVEVVCTVGDFASFAENTKYYQFAGLILSSPFKTIFLSKLKKLVLLI